MKLSRILMIIGTVLLAGLYALPLWKITLLAPQYPDPLGLNIHIDHLSDGIQYNDVNNIDLLNHYIGMAHLPSKINVEKGVISPLKEFTYFPIVVGAMILLGILLAIVGRPKYYLYWLIVMILLGIGGLYDFYSWLYHYGHYLDPNAILKLTDPVTGDPMGYQPPFFGYKKLLNFEVYSYPSSGAYFIVASMITAFLAFLLGMKSTE